WIEAFNSNGALVARAVGSRRVKEGMCTMYHAQEKIVNVPGAGLSGQRGGIHNSVTRTVLKPTHMIGGYVHHAYGFNYCGTGGWTPRARCAEGPGRAQRVGSGASSAGCTDGWTSPQRIGYAWLKDAEPGRGPGYAKDWENQARGKDGWVRGQNGRLEPRGGAK